MERREELALRKGSDPFSSAALLPAVQSDSSSYNPASATLSFRKRPPVLKDIRYGSAAEVEIIVPPRRPTSDHFRRSRFGSGGRIADPSDGGPPDRKKGG